MLDKYISLVKPYYNEKHRVFHDWQHIQSGLDMFDKLNSGTTEQKIAWLFHDIIYIPTQKDNEEKSALFAIDMIKSNQDTKNIDTSLVGIIINDTKYHLPTIKESALVLDIDMSSLACKQYSDFYKLRIMAAKEYSSFGKEAVVSGTVSFINKTLRQERIFTTPEFSSMEEIARENLKKYLIEFSESPQFIEIFPQRKQKNKI